MNRVNFTAALVTGILVLTASTLSGQELLEAKLKKIDIDKDKIKLGAGVSLADAGDAFDKVDFCPAFSRALLTLASPQVRNIATVGGSVMWTHPSSDLWPLYLVFKAKANVLTKDGVIITKDIESLQHGQDVVLNVTIVNPGANHA